jgi:hypothetical protein
LILMKKPIRLSVGPAGQGDARPGSIKKLGLALVLLSLTAGCGQKGPLALPAPAPAASAVHSN